MYRPSVLLAVVVVCARILCFRGSDAGFLVVLPGPKNDVVLNQSPPMLPINMIIVGITHR